MLIDQWKSLQKRLHTYVFENILEKDNTLQHTKHFITPQNSKKHFIKNGLSSCEGIAKRTGIKIQFLRYSEQFNEPKYLLNRIILSGYWLN